MAETLVRCPGCRVGIKIKAVPPGRKAFPCPKCGKVVPYPKPEPEEEEEILDVEAADDEDEQDDVEPSPPPRRRRARRDDDDEPEDDEEDDRPRRRKKKKKERLEPQPWMWPVGLGGMLIAAVATIGVLYVLMGGEGFPPPQDGPPIIKPIVLGFITLIGLVVAIPGAKAMVDQQLTMAKYFLTVKMWEETYSGTMATVIGGSQCAIGGLVLGTGIYGLVF